MKKLIFIACFNSLSIFVFVSGCNNAAQNQSSTKSQINNKTVVIKEIKSSNNIAIQAPDDCLRNFHDFFEYVQKSEPDISHDQKAQNRVLSVTMRNAVAKKNETEDNKAKENPADKREYPDNSSFIGAWDYPTTYEIVGSRKYGERVIIDVEYTWGENTQYAGTQRLSSFIFKKIDHLCQLEDVYSFEGDFNQTESLIHYFRTEY